jgi:two-component system response regulator YesN
MSGLELAKVIHDILPDVLVILFSGHSEFSYAQKAIRYGVVRYVLKPVDDDEFAAALEDVGRLLDEREERKHWTRRMMRDHWLRAHLSGYRVAVDERSAAPEWLQTPDFDTYRVGLLPPGSKLEAGRIEDLEGVLHTLVLSDGRIATVLEETRLQTAEDSLVSAGLRIGISTEHGTPEEIRGALTEAQEALSALFARPGVACLRFEDVAGLSDTARRSLFDTAGALSERMAHYEFENGAEEIRSFLAEIRESEAPDYLAKQLAFTVALGVQRLASRWVGNDTEDRLDTIPDPFEAVEHSRNISELEARFAGAVSHTLERIEAARAKREQDSRLDAILRYIDEHYHELISLDDVAEFAGMHPSRFSVWFKGCMGETYIEYLTRLRISVAKQLLSRSAEVYIRDVALQVGYPDARYFSQVFKRLVGTTPRAYQHAHLSLEDAES